MTSGSSQQSIKALRPIKKSKLDKQLEMLVFMLKDILGMGQSAAGTLANQWRTLRDDDTKYNLASTFVLRAINHHINAYRVQSFENFKLDVNIHPVHGSGAINVPLRDFNDGSLQIGHREYTFQIGDSSKDMRVRLQQGTIKIFFCGRFQSISAYLKEFSSDSNTPFDPHRAYDAQRSWWSLNGKTFNLMALPGELRNAIYDQILGPAALPYPKHKARRGRSIPTTNTAIMRLNKQTHNEASHRFYNHSTFLLENGVITQKLLQNIRIRSHLRNMTLALTHSGYLELFRFDPRATEPHSHAIRNIRETNFVSLEIHISAPSRVADRAYLEGACQKAVIERIFQAAWPSIQGHPVTITGYIKDSQKAAISARLDAAHQAFAKWSTLKMLADGSDTCTLKEYDTFMRNLSEEPAGGVCLADSEAGSADSGTEAEASFVTTHSLDCFCPKKCQAKGWTAQG